MPRYEFEEGSSSKFWEIKLDGKSFTTTWGKIGTDGQSKTKTYKTDAEAKKEHDALVAEKVKKGYRLVGGKAAPAAAPAAAATKQAKPAKAATKQAKPAKGATKAKQAPAPDDDDEDDDAGAEKSSASGKPGARYFEMVEGSSSKFWEITIEETTVVTRYGKIGTDGQSTEKELDSKGEAWKEYEKLVNEKTRKGYKEKSGGGGSRDARDPALEEAILAAPEDPQPYLVYADWLQEQGDPRGELISLQASAAAKPKDGKLAKAAADLLAAQEDYFLGPLSEHVKTHDGSDEPAIEWRNGFIHGFKLSVDGEVDGEYEGEVKDLLDLVLRHPSGRFLVSLTIGIPGATYDCDCSDLLAVLAKRAPRSLQSLHVGDFEYPDQTEMSWFNVGDVGKVWKALPNLRRVIVQGGSFDLGTIDAPALRHAEFRTGGLATASAKAIARAKMPAIEHLDIWYGSAYYNGDASLADVKPLLDRTDLPSLRHLGLMNCEFVDEICGVLAKSKLLPKLAELDLSMGTMTDAGAKALAAHADAFKHLQKLNVDDNYLGSDGIAAIKKLCKNVVVGSQRDAADDEDHRYASVGE